MQYKQKPDQSKLKHNGDCLNQGDRLNTHLIHFFQNFSKTIIRGFFFLRQGWGEKTKTTKFWKLENRWMSGKWLS